MRLAAAALAGLAFAAGARARAADVSQKEAPQKIVVDARGPLALVEVTRQVVPPAAEPGSGSEALLDLALPDGSALASVEVRDGGRWRRIDGAGADSAHAADAYRAESAARGVTPAAEPFDADATLRLRLLRSAGHGRAPFTVRTRFAVIPTTGNGQMRVRFPAPTERLPPPADVTLRLRGPADVEIDGARKTVTGGDVSGHASMRAAWEISWAPRDPTPNAAPPIETRAAVAKLAPDRTALAFLARRRASATTALPPTVLFVVDRSRSVGLPGLSAERELVRTILDALPPSTRFNTLFFDRGTAPLFPMLRPATREAMEAFENEMVPDQLRNGTDLPAALRAAGALLQRESAGFAPATLVVLVTDGAFPDALDAAALDRALAVPAGLDVTVAALGVRVPDDEPIGPRPLEALRGLAAARGGVARALRSNELHDAVPTLLADLQRGGDVGGLELVADGNLRKLDATLPPGEALAGIVPIRGPLPRRARFEAVAHGQHLSIPTAPQRIEADWLRPWFTPATSGPRLLTATSVVALVEPVAHPAPPADDQPKGSMDRMVVRNVLSLAYMPRARACYLNRKGATPAQRELTGKVRLAIDLVRGEVDNATVVSSTLDNPAIEACLRESAFAVEVPRAARSDAPVTAVLNMVFRPRTPAEKKPEIDLGAVGDEIDVVIDEMRRRDAHSADGGAPRED
ncbi:MAG TPA: VWA domain-containing protein [Polyangia bacterium]|nr:VWA domain-containing protein [Polyangia bacterium]